MSDVVVQMVVFLLIAVVLGFAAGWWFRGWGLDGSTRMHDGYERGQRASLLRELNAARIERDEARTEMLSMRAATAQPAQTLSSAASTPSSAASPAAAPAARTSRTTAPSSSSSASSGASSAKPPASPASASASRATAPKAAVPKAAEPKAAPSPSATPASGKPAAPAPKAKPDDLKRIKGVGPKLEKTLHSMGVTQFSQIAIWTDKEVEEVNAKLRFQGRIERDNWIAQAREFAAQ